MIIVTGGTSGLGKAITSELREIGEKVLTLSRTTLKNSSDHLPCDVSDYESLRATYKTVKSLNEPISALINCAGIASMNLAITTPPEVSQKIIQTNLLGTIYTNQVFAPLLIKNKKGRIVNFSTIAVRLGLRGESVYVASKAGVEGFSRVLANELSPFNITVNCIAPGPIRTDLLKGVTDKQIREITSRQIIRSEMAASDVVDIVRLLLSDRSSTITGQVLNVGGS